MDNKVIFLSYRRDDSPGYVKSLEKDLEEYYGVGSVFRDVKDIAGGTKWKKVIDDNLHNAAVLLLVIGPRWDGIWQQRMDDEVNYVEYELNLAHGLNIPVIPITLDGSSISKTTDLKSVSWLRETQHYDMSDKQGRWENDIKGLLNLLENIKGLKRVDKSSTTPIKPQPEKKKSGVLKTLIILLLAGVVGAVVYSNIDPEPDPQDREVSVVNLDVKCQNPTTRIAKQFCQNPDITNVLGRMNFVYKELNQEISAEQFADLQINQRNWEQNLKTCIESRKLNVECVVKSIRNRNATLKQILTKARDINDSSSDRQPQAQPVPDISGTWQGKDGTIYNVEQRADGSFEIVSPGYGTGVGKFIENMPNKFTVTMHGIGKGEFSVSNSDSKAIGWMVDINGEKIYDTLVKVSP